MRDLWPYTRGVTRLLPSRYRLGWVVADPSGPWWGAVTLRGPEPGQGVPRARSNQRCFAAPGTSCGQARGTGGGELVLIRDAKPSTPKVTCHSPDPRLRLPPLSRGGSDSPKEFRGGPTGVPAGSSPSGVKVVGRVNITLPGGLVPSLRGHKLPDRGSGSREKRSDEQREKVSRRYVE